MKGFIITDIFRISLNDILLELHFNVKSNTFNSSFTVSISDDGETILIEKKDKWLNLEDFNFELFNVQKISASDNTIFKLIGCKILDFAFGKDINDREETLYYLKLVTDKYDFLFLNNGDEGYYTTDSNKISEILKHNIFEFTWISG